MSFHPPKRTLMGPGPSDVDPRISEALGRPTIGHLDPEFIRLMDETKTLLQYAFMTNNELTPTDLCTWVSGYGSMFCKISLKLATRLLFAKMEFLEAA